MGGFKDSTAFNHACRFMWPECFLTYANLPDDFDQVFDKAIIELLQLFHFYKPAIEVQDFAVPIMKIRARANELEEQYLSLSEEQRALCSRPPIMLWGQLKRAISQRVCRIINNFPNINTAVLCIDHLGMCPRAKEMTQEKRAESADIKSVVRFKDTNMFQDDMPIFNDLDSILREENGRGRAELIRYFSDYFIKEFPYGEYMRNDITLVVHGGIDEHNKPHLKPISMKKIFDQETMQYYIEEREITDGHFVCGESDLSAASFIHYFGPQSNVLWVTLDFDQFLTSLSLMRDRYKTPDSAGTIMLLRPKRISGEKSISEYVDMRGIFLRICSMLARLQQSWSVPCDPVDLMFMLCLMRGNDYVEALPGVTFETLFQTLANVYSLAPPVCTQVVNGIPLCRINYANYVAFVCLAYRNRYNVERSQVAKRKFIDPSESPTLQANGEYADEELLTLRQYLLKNKLKAERSIKQAPPLPEDMRGMVASLARTINYYAHGYKKAYAMPDDFETTSFGESVHGYELQADDTVSRAKKIVKKEVY